MKTQERRRVLVIDDNKNLLKGLNDFLGFKGFEVATAESGEAGLAKMEGFKPDIILLDIAMPGMGGVGFLKRITLPDGTLQHPVLVFTARSTTKEFFESISVDGFIAKPYDKDELVRRIEDILARQPVPIAETSSPAPRTALLGEDEEIVAEHLAETFQRAGYMVEVVGSGPEVVEKATVNQPSVIVLKHILPRMNGNAVKALLESMPRTRSIPVVLYDGCSLGKKEKEEAYSGLEDMLKEYMKTEDAAQILKTANGILQKGMAGAPRPKGQTEQV
jgi:CheY-like chemotaxis protein